MTSTGAGVLVTGAGRGIGRAIALRLAHDGADVAVNDVNGDSAEAVAAEVGAAGATGVALPGDVTDRATVFGLVEQAAKAFGRLDVLVNNAGIVQVKPIVDVLPDELEQIFSVNLFATLYGIQAAAAHMRGRGGKIINAASIAGHSGFDYLGPYSATKFGVVGLTQAAAKELAPERITVNAYCPGIVGTDMWELIDEQLGGYLHNERGATREQYATTAALGRVQRPEEVASLVSYLAGPDSDFMTGQSVVIDGGIVMR